MLWEILQNSQQKICAETSFLVFSWGSTLLVNETVNYEIMIQKLKHMYYFLSEVQLLKRAAHVKEQVSEAVVHSLQN